jgi:hypothetical protein
MRKLALILVLATTTASALTATPPTPSNKSDWTRVRVLAAGTRVHIKTLDHGNIQCAVTSVDADSITCGGVTFQRASITYIKNRHKTRSTLVGVAVGWGTAGAITAGYAESCKLNCKVGTATGVAIFAIGDLVATPILFGVYDLTAGTIYKAPRP